MTKSEHINSIREFGNIRSACHIVSVVTDSQVVHRGGNANLDRGGGSIKIRFHQSQCCRCNVVGVNTIPTSAGLWNVAQKREGANCYRAQIISEEGAYATNRRSSCTTLHLKWSQGTAQSKEYVNNECTSAPWKMTGSIQLCAAMYVKRRRVMKTRSNGSCTHVLHMCRHGLH